jgi:DNA-directed RNA polymerase specialized sigma24 family protein
MHYPTTAQVSARLEQYARTIAPYVAFVLTLVVHTYHLGRLLGRWVHSTNDLLARNWPTRPCTAETSTTEPLAAVIVETGSAVTLQTVTTETVLALYAQGLSQRAIAAQLGCSRATVRRRMAATA